VNGRPEPGDTDLAGPTAAPAALTARTATAASAAPAAWLAVTVALAVPAALAFFAPRAATDLLVWRPELAAGQPWRAWSAVWIHLSGLHLAANLAGAALVAALGVTARLPRRAALAWLLAWPLTQWGLLAMPALLRYGGLSGVLHAGVAVIAVELIARRADRRDRALGFAIAAVLAVKLLGETPWRGPLAYPAGWDIAVAPIAHATGVLAGLLMAALLIVLRTRR